MIRLYIVLIVMMLFALIGYRLTKNSPVQERNAHAYTELMPTKDLLISQRLFEEFTGAKRIAEIAQEEDLNLIILIDGPISEQEKSKWKQKHLGHSIDLSKVILIPAAHTSYWVRDFSPIPTSFRFSSLGKVYLTDFTYRSNSQIDDLAAYQLALYLESSVIHTPLSIDGGNFISNGRDCIVTEDFQIREKTFASNSSFRKAASIFRDYLGCDSLLVLKDPAHAHVDMFAKFVQKNVVLVNQIDTRKLSDLKLETKDFNLSYIYARQLDAAANVISKHYTVIRIPMPHIENDIFRTYTNSLIINKRVILPSYRQNKHTGKSYLDSASIQEMETTVAQIYERFGYKVEFINSDELISYGGALHCVTTSLSAHSLSSKKF